VNSTLAIKRKEISAALVAAASHNKLTFKSRQKKGERKDEMSKRVKDMIRHVAQYRCKSSAPSWLTKLSLDRGDLKGLDSDEEVEEEAAGEEEAEVDEVEDDDSDEVPIVNKKPAAARVTEKKESVTKMGREEVMYDYGYDSCANMAYRLIAGRKKQVPEHAAEMNIPKKSQPTDAMIAVFKEGEEQLVMNGGKKLRDPANQGWLGKTSDGTKVEALLRSNNRKNYPPQKLTCIKVGDDQLLQVDVKHFATKLAEGKSLEQTALDWAPTLAKDFAKGKVDKKGALEINT
ncbi:unnamed protein product, partial [Prorocentrum cordatum]